MELFKLFGTIAVNNSDANSSIEETTEKASSLGDKMGKVGENVKAFGDKVSNVGGSLTKGITVPAVAAGGAVVAFATKSASAADNVDKMSQKIGISREAYQELDFICSQSGSDVDSLRVGMKTLTNQMGAAADGTKSATEMFDKLGISIYDSNGNMKSQEQMLFDTLEALQNVENQTEKAALANDLFGKTGSDLMPLINGATGSIEEMKQQAHDLGLVLDDEAIDSGVEYTDKMDQLKRSFQTTAAEAGTKMLPMLTELGDFLITKGIPAFEKVIEKVENVFNWFDSLDSGTKNLITTIAGIVVAIGPVLLVVGNVISTIGTVISVVSKIKTVVTVLTPILAGVSAPVLGIVAAVAAAIAIGVLLYKNWDTIKEKAGELSDKIASVFGKIKDTIKEKIDGAKESVHSAIEKIKGFFKFEWSLPKLKLPHPTISGSFSLNPPSVPHFGIDWYAKAMDEPYMLDSATIFGSMNGKLLGGGEKGSEVVIGKQTMLNMIGEAVDSKNQEIVDAINRLSDFLQMYIPDMANMQLVMDSGVVIGELAPGMDAALGKLAIRNGRGV